MNIRIIGRSADLEHAPTLAGVEIAPGLVALLVITAASQGSTVVASTSAALLLPTNVLRRGGTIMNDPTSVGNLHVVELDSGGNPVDRILAPGNSLDVTEGYLGRVSGWWDGAATGHANVAEIS